MIKNAIISALIIYSIQQIWVPGTSFMARAYANSGFFIIFMIILWMVEDYVKGRKHGKHRISKADTQSN